MTNSIALNDGGLESMLFKRVTLFRFFGFPVKADASWLFLSVFISWTFSANFYPGVYPGHEDGLYHYMGIATLGGLILSIIVHEVAHAVIAEYYDMPITSITLFVFGGVAEMEGPPSHPKGEFFMAIAGPIMSGLLALMFWAAAGLYEETFSSDANSIVLKYLGDLNLLIVLFNVIPVFPLDGGRALRAAIWKYKNNLVLATRISSAMGRYFAYGLMVYASYKIVLHDDLMSGVWIGLMGLFTLGAGSYAVKQTESRSLLENETVARFTRADIVSVSPDLTITDFVDAYVYKHFQKSFPVIDRGELVGLISLQTVLSMNRQKWHWLHVASVMEPVTDKNSVASDFNAADALEMLQRQGKDLLLVREGRKLLGAVSYRDLVSYVSVSVTVDSDLPIRHSR